MKCNLWGQLCVTFEKINFLKGIMILPQSQARQHCAAQEAIMRMKNYL